ncbi:MAG TPA: hypothetical protein VFS08_18705 [Gemmatimonadaceae bacterium]|nr:hypothetical protein [Gemmatimonadaceae bacterium]
MGRVVVLQLADVCPTTSEPVRITTGNQPFPIPDAAFTTVVELFWP